MLSPLNQLASGAEKPLLLAVGDGLGNVAAHHLAQDQLAVARALVVALGLAARLVFVDADHLGQVAELQPRRQPHREIDEIVVEKRDARFERMRHGEFVLDHQQAIEEGLRLEIERMVDVVLGPSSAALACSVENVREKYRASTRAALRSTSGRARPCNARFGNQTLPEAKILCPT